MKVKYILKNINITFILFAFLLSCQYRINVSHKIDKNGEVTFFIESDSWFSKKQKVNRLSLKDLKRDKSIWIIYSKDNESIYLYKIVYGQTPKEFDEVIKAKKLRKGKKYRLYIGGPGASGTLDFVYDY